MPSRALHRMTRAMQWATGALGILTLLIAVAAFVRTDSGSLAARLLPAHMRGQTPWKTIGPEELDQGRTLPANTNVILIFPEDMEPTPRRTVFGHRGEDLRYWGYCFPQNEDRARALRQGRFPGTIFLSEKERAERRRQELNIRSDRFSITRHLTEADLNQDRYYRGAIRHQQEIFRGGTSCYVMSEGPIPVGTDRDGDFANSAVERDYQTDPQNPDTDADGVLDGREIFFLGTKPTLRDSDGDGLIDGMEDANRNGRRDLNETDATLWDTDRDGLCDGLCKVEKGQKLRGEDKNINGILDPGEYNPLLQDTDGNGVLDGHEVYLCELAGGADC